MHGRSLRPFTRGRLTLGFTRELGSLLADSFNRTFSNKLMTRSNADASRDLDCWTSEGAGSTADDSSTSVLFTEILVGAAFLTADTRLESE